MGWRFIPKAEKVCRRCGKALKMTDVGEDRTVHGTFSKRDFLCNECVRERSASTQAL